MAKDEEGMSRCWIRMADCRFVEVEAHGTGIEDGHIIERYDIVLVKK